MGAASALKRAQRVESLGGDGSVLVVGQISIGYLRDLDGRVWAKPLDVLGGSIPPVRFLQSSDGNDGDVHTHVGWRPLARRVCAQSDRNGLLGVYSYDNDVNGISDLV